MLDVKPDADEWWDMEGAGETLPRPFKEQPRWSDS
jgi:hypothetical protein